jgi:2-polyprenyl-6-methoxyphenol hydroxylase-like FAD-dependent oxidoreductase
MANRAIIIGGGVGGLTAAIALRKAGIDHAVFERRGDLSDLQVGTGLNLWPNAIRALRELGLDKEVEAAGSQLERFEQRSWRGSLLASWAIGDIGRSVGAPTVSISRPDLHRVLTNALGEGALTVGANFTGFTQDGDGVSATFEDGHEGRADFLIGADGINSATRAQLRGRQKPVYAGYTAWRGVAEITDEAAPKGVFTLYWGRGLRFGYYHVGGERIYWFGIANAPEGGQDGPGGRKQDILDRFGAWMHPIRRLVEAADEAVIQRTDIADRDPIESWGEGRVTLLGDAAHPMTFNVGQGACQTIEDGVLLGKLLAANGDVVGSLASYEAARRERTGPMVLFARRLGRLGRWENPVACFGRDRLMRLMLRFGLRKQESDFGFQL